MPFGVLRRARKRQRTASPPPERYHPAREPSLDSITLNEGSLLDFSTDAVHFTSDHDAEAATLAPEAASETDYDPEHRPERPLPRPPLPPHFVPLADPTPGLPPAPTAAPAPAPAPALAPALAPRRRFFSLTSPFAIQHATVARPAPATPVVFGRRRNSVFGRASTASFQVGGTPLGLGRPPSIFGWLYGTDSQGDKPPQIETETLSHAHAQAPTSPFPETRGTPVNRDRAQAGGDLDRGYVRDHIRNRSDLHDSDLMEHLDLGGGGGGEAQNEGGVEEEERDTRDALTRLTDLTREYARLEVYYEEVHRRYGEAKGEIGELRELVRELEERLVVRERRIRLLKQRGGKRAR